MIFREIEEVTPLPKSKGKSQENYKSWVQHHSKKRFLHREILREPTKNRDFILSLPADLIYHVTQLWESKEDPSQWIYMLHQIENLIPHSRTEQREEVRKVKISWYKLMNEYGIEFPKEDESKWNLIKKGHKSALDS